jgi:hypothetical protein
MPIVAGDIDFHLSGVADAENADPNAALGGVLSSVQIVDATLHNLFDVVSGIESRDGDIEYRCFYVRNAHATLTLMNPEIWIQTNTPHANTTIAIGLDPAGVGDGSVTGVADTIVDEEEAPDGVTFFTPTGEGDGLEFPADLAPGEVMAVWARRTVTLGATALNVDNAVLRVQGETLE